MYHNLPDYHELRQKLESIFPEGTPDRNYVIREMAAKVVFVFLYIDAIEGSDNQLAPKHITRMSEVQSKLFSESDRSAYYSDCNKPGYKPIAETWYKENTREPIRDETIKQGFQSLGVVIVDSSVPTTSSKGRYQIRRSFADLLINGDNSDVIKWQTENLNQAQLARIKIVGSMTDENEVSVFLPDGSSRSLKPGPSSHITKAVVETFTKLHLKNAAVVWISESGNKVVMEDERLMAGIKLPIDQKTLLPDIVLADTGRQKLLIVFVEVVATDGPITEQRKAEILKMCLNAGYRESDILFVSAFSDRNSSPLKSRLSSIATDSLIWCASEPEILLWIADGQEKAFEFE